MGVQWTTLAAVAAGGAIGAVARFGLAGWAASRLPNTFPYGTLAVNVLGCLVLGLFYPISLQATLLSPAARSFVSVGLLGAFTTYSTFALEAWILFREGSFRMGALYVLVTLAACLLATGLGLGAGFFLSSGERGPRPHEQPEAGERLARPATSAVDGGDAGAHRGTG